MTDALRQRSRLCACLTMVFVSGCFYTTAGTKLAPITPPLPDYKPSVEQTVGDFSFTLEGGKMVTSNYAGRLLNDGILGAWKERGYIREAHYVENAAFSGAADYNITLSGTQYGASSIGLQLLSGLTLFLVPYTVTQSYDIQYTLVDVKTGKKYSASVQESNETYFELFLLFTLPVAQRGQRQMMERMGDHLYEQLHRQGAFQRPADRPAAP